MGVGGRLLLAFLAISAFAVLGAAAATYPLLEIGKVLDGIVQHRLPSALASQDLSRQAERIVAAAPALLTVTDSSEHEELSRKIEDEASRLESLLAELKRSETDITTIDSLELIVNRLRINLNALDDLVAARLDLEEQKKQLLANVFATHTGVQQLLAPWVLVVEGEMARARRAISETEGASGARELNESIQSLRALQRALLQASNVNDMLHQMTAAEDGNRLKVLAFRIQQALGEIETLAKSFGAKLRPLVAEHIDSFRNVVTSPNGLPKVRENELSLVADAEGLLEENKELSNQLTTAVDELLSKVREEAGEVNVEAQSVQAMSANILLGAVAVSLVSSILIVWLYVSRNLVSRLKALSSSMLAIAQGNLDARLPAPGSDEIGRMAEALSIFRDTAVEVKESNLREIREAQNRLTHAIESISEGFSLYDASDHLVVCNTRYRQMLYPGMQEEVQPGTTFEGIIRRAAEKGLVVDAGGDIDGWVRRRLTMHQQPSRPHIQRRGDGRWIRVNERKTDDGGTVAVYTDITEDKQREAELREAKERAEQALEELTHAQESLIHAEKMASLGQLTAGIAHEIKNPLNFVNNFADSSRELLEELTELLERSGKQPGSEVREELRDLIQSLSAFQQKIREHGERADRIVKSMLSHAREEPGTVRPTDLNALIEENLNLAYHSARAEDQNFNITPEIELDRQIGEIDAFAQELGRVLLNLFSNGFYATQKRKLEWKEKDYRPTLRISSRDLGDKVEVRVWDNGTGIPQATIDKIFTPFFTTKPTGEGTGLGLSLSYEIVVQQHHGQLQVETREGEFTEFIVTLPKSVAGTPVRQEMS